MGQIATASDDSLEVTVQTLDAVDDTIDLAEVVLVSPVDAVDALEPRRSGAMSETPTYGDLAHRSEGGGGAVVQLVHTQTAGPTVRSCRSN